MPHRRPPRLTAVETALWLLEHRVEFDQGCALWTGAIGSQGYGNIYYDGKTYNAQRFMKIALHGAPPDLTMKATHPLFCPRICVAPEHTEWKKESRCNQS